MVGWFPALYGPYFASLSLGDMNNHCSIKRYAERSPAVRWLPSSPIHTGQRYLVSWLLLKNDPVSSTRMGWRVDTKRADMFAATLKAGNVTAAYGAGHCTAHLYPAAARSRHTSPNNIIRWRPKHAFTHFRPRSGQEGAIYTYILW